MMSSKEIQSVPEEAFRVIQEYAGRVSRGQPIGSMSTSIYDFAWASMVLKNVNGAYEWLFPKSFQLVLDSQLPDGGWESHAFDVDGLLNTMAALLAILKHRSETKATNEVPRPKDLEARVSRAVA
jgi:hypothetical protein